MPGALTRDFDSLHQTLLAEPEKRAARSRLPRQIRLLGIELPDCGVPTLGRGDRRRHIEVRRNQRCLTILICHSMLLFLDSRLQFYFGHSPLQACFHSSRGLWFQMAMPPWMALSLAPTMTCGGRSRISLALPPPSST